MKGLKYLLGITVAMATMLASCDTDNMGEVYESKTLGATFGGASQSVSFPAHGYEGFDVEVIRAQTSEAATVNLTASLLDAKGNPLAVPSTIQVPSSVTFAAGEGVASFHVTVGDITPGQTYKLAISLDETVAPVDASMTKVVSIYRDYTYSILGTGVFSSMAYSEDGVVPAQWEVTVEKADQITWYRAMGVYEEGKDILFKVASDGKSVTVDEQGAWSHASYGTVYVAGEGELKNGFITVLLEHYVSAGSFGSFKEVLQLPVAE